MMKSLTLAAGVVLATTTFAVAENAFPIGESFESTDLLELDVVRAEADGVLEVYDYHRGVRGPLLGSEEVRAGANTNVKVNFSNMVNRDILLVLKVDGIEVLMKQIDNR